MPEQAGAVCPGHYSDPIVVLSVIHDRQYVGETGWGSEVKLDVQPQCDIAGGDQASDPVVFIVHDQTVAFTAAAQRVDDVSDGRVLNV